MPPASAGGFFTSAPPWEALHLYHTFAYGTYPIPGTKYQMTNHTTAPRKPNVDLGQLRLLLALSTRLCLAGGSFGNDVAETPALLSCRNPHCK